MSTTQVKKELQHYIEKADDRILHAMYAMLQSYLQEENEIVAFTVQGHPLTKKEMLTALDEAVADVEKGNGLTSDEIRNAKKKWK